MIVEGPTVTVLGESSVLVLDARRAAIPKSDGDKPPVLSGARGVQLAVLRSGDRSSFEAR